jgi:hypothetical protein
LPVNRAENGQDVVETALLMPLLLLLLIGVIEFAFIIFTYSSVALLAREGARCGVIADADAADVLLCVTTRVIGPLNRCEGGLTVIPDFAPADIGRDDPPVIDVEVVCDWPLLSGWLAPVIESDGVLRLGSIARMRRE